MNNSLLRLDVERRVIPEALFYLPLFLLDGILLPVPLLLFCSGDDGCLSLVFACDKRELLGVACWSAAGAVHTSIRLSDQLLADDGCSLVSVSEAQ